MPAHHLNSTQSQITLTSQATPQGRFRNPPWWNRRTRLERVLVTLASVATIMCVSMGVALVYVGYNYQINSLDRPSMVIPRPNSNSLKQTPMEGDGPDNGSGFKSSNHVDPSDLPPSHQRSNGKEGDVCLHPGCVKAAADFLRNMNTDIDPCEDFYQFSCGSWVDNQVIPDDRTSVSIFTVLQDDLNNKLRSLIERPPHDDEASYVTKMRSMYKSCMNLPEIERVGNEPLAQLLRQLGGWPVVEGDNWNGTDFNWLDTLIQYRKTGFSHDLFLDLSVTPDFRNNTQHVIDVDQAALGMPDRSYLLRGLNDTTVAGYYKLMVESAVILGADRAQAEKEMLDALNFETILANYSLPREERRNISLLYNKISIEDMSKLAPNTPWTKYFNELLGFPVSDKEEIIVNVPAFVAKVDKLLPVTDKRILANYMMWRVTLQSYAALGKKWRELAQEYNKVITGQDREEPRWEQCMGSLTGSLGIALSSLYIRHHFKEGSKDRAMQMVDYILLEFHQILREVDWMDETTRQKAIAKANAITPYIGYPDQLLNDTLVGELYQNLELESDTYFKNFQNLRKWSTDYAFEQLRKPNLKGDWRKHGRSAVVNAYYNALENSIEFPAGILQGIFFDKDRPNYLNFGAIGFVIGHEITHGFDDRGRQFDKDGNNKNWWDHQTDLNFRNRTQCIIDQYNNYTVPENGLHVNGVNTQGENIADNGGLKEAFRAYRKWAADQPEGQEKPLPGLPYKPEQLFWISAANVWCGKYRAEVLKLRVLVGSHSPPTFRVIGPMSNIEEFATSFDCPVGSPMNPINKCAVW